MVALQVDRALFVVQDLVELILRLSCFLTMWTAIDSPNDIVKLTLACRVLLVAAASTIIVTLPIVVVVAAREATVFLLLFVSPALHHIP